MAKKISLGWTTLHCVNGHSNKSYTVFAVPQANEDGEIVYIVKSFYGPMGRPMASEGKAIPCGKSLVDVEAASAKVISQKIKKGYHIDSTGMNVYEVPEDRYEEKTSVDVLTQLNDALAEMGSSW